MSELPAWLDEEEDSVVGEARRRARKIEESPWARKDGENVECSECPLLFDKTHPRLPLASKVKVEDGSPVCPHCALGK